jgi:hypothetical protein
MRKMQGIVQKRFDWWLGAGAETSCLVLHSIILVFELKHVGF